TVDGGRVSADALFSPGRSLEFVAKFAGDPFQHAGLGVTFNGPSYAMFSTFSGGGGLYARTAANAGVTIDDPIPPPPGAPIDWGTSFHRFRIDWTAFNVVYWIDGVR